MTVRRQELWADLLRELGVGVLSQPWHWFQYHLRFLPPRPFVRSIVEAAIDCEEKLPGLGRQLVQDIAGIGGMEKHEPHYDQLMQKLAELLVLRRLLTLPWPEGTVFEHEPALAADGKRPELRVLTPEQVFLFEVKAPSLLDHQRKRQANDIQAPTRALDRGALERLAGEGGLTLPRDNPVKDFLIDSERKFQPFKAAAPSVSMLIIVWDDHIYEPISVLTQPQCGLLTENSYFRDEAGNAITFPNVDAVVLIRHLLYFKRAAAEQPLIERRDALDFGDEQALPNVFIPAHGGAPIPEMIRKGLRALPLDDPFIQAAAEYKPLEVVFWMGGK